VHNTTINNINIQFVRAKQGCSSWCPQAT